MDKCCVGGSVEFNRLGELSEYLKAIADINRLQIMCLLSKGERCVCEIYGPLKLPQNLVSHHLKALRDAGLVTSRRQGKWIYYRIDAEKLSYLTDLYNQIILGGNDGDQDTGDGLCKLQQA